MYPLLRSLMCRQSIRYWSLLFLAVFVTIYGVKYTTRMTEEQSTEYVSLEWDVMLQKLTNNRMIVISTVTRDNIDLAENLYLGSFKGLSITNYVFLSYDEESFLYMSQRSINVFRVKLNKKNNKKMYKAILFNRFEYIYHALTMGIRVFYVDVDVHLFKNPLEYLANLSEKYDIITQQAIEKNEKYCAGLFFVRPSDQSKGLFSQLKQKNKYPGSDQQALNTMINKMKTWHKPIVSMVLPLSTFPNSVYYGRHVAHGNPIRREFAGDNPCVSCYAVRSKEDIYTLKEHLFWQVDQNGYYSDPKRRYITYYSNKDQQSYDVQRYLLQTVLNLARHLERTLILPKFCCKFKSTSPCDSCNLHSLSLNLFKSLDTNLYREHMFLNNSLVPDVVRSSVSPIHDLHTHLASVYGKEYASKNDQTILMQALSTVKEHVLNITLDSLTLF